MRSEASVLAVVSRDKDGSWTMMSPLDVVDHRACRLGGPEIPRHSQQQSDNSDNWQHRAREQRPERDPGRPVGFSPVLAASCQKSSAAAATTAKLRFYDRVKDALLQSTKSAQNESDSHVCAVFQCPFCKRGCYPVVHVLLACRRQHQRPPLPGPLRRVHGEGVQAVPEDGDQRRHLVYEHLKILKPNDITDSKRPDSPPPSSQKGAEL